MIGRRYPIPRPEGNDPRFTFGLTYALAELLTEAGYPELTGADFAELQGVLFTFLYAPAEAQS